MGEKMIFLAGAVLGPLLLTLIPIIKPSVDFVETYAQGEYLTLAGAAVCSMILNQVVRFVRKEGDVASGIYMVVLIVLLMICGVLFSGRLTDLGEFKELSFSFGGHRLDSSACLLIGAVIVGICSPSGPGMPNALHAAGAAAPPAEEAVVDA